MQRFVLPACGGFLGLAFSFYAQSWLDVDYNFWLTFFYIFIGVVLGLTAEHALIAPPYTPMVMRIIVWVSSGIYLYAIILLFTPFTHNVDEIKPAIMLSAGAYIWLIYSCALFVIGQPGRIFKILLPLLGFLALFFLSILLADSQIRWIGWFNLRFYLFTIVMIFIVASTITTKEELIHACSIFTALALLSCLFGILHYYQQLGFLERFAERDASNKQLWANLIRTLQQNRQMFGTILSTDFFAAYLIMALPGAVALSFGASQIYNRILGFVTTLTMLACIYQTNSNETILGVAAFIFIFALGYNYIQPGSVLRRNLKLTVLLSAITLAVLIFMTWSEFVPRIQSLDGAFRARGIIYKGGWDMFLAHPWFGWGPGSFRMIFPLFRHQDYDITEISNVTLFAHNQFLGMLCETGIFSFICYMVFLAMLCRFLLREIRKRPLSDISIFQFAFLGGIVAIHIQNFFSPNYRWVAPAIAYNTMLGLAIASGNITQIAAAESDDETALAPLEAWLKQNRKIWASCLIAVSFIGIALSSKTGFNYFRSAIENNKGILHQQSADKLREYVRRGQTVEGGRLTDEGKELYLNEIKLREKTAVQHFEKSIVYDPTFQTAFYKIAHTYNQQGFHIEALQMYNDLSYLNSDYSEIYYNYGVIFQAMYQIGFYIDLGVLQRYGEILAQKKARDLQLSPEEMQALESLKDLQNLPIDQQRVMGRLPADLRKKVFEIVRSCQQTDHAVADQLVLKDLFYKDDNRAKRQRDRLMIEVSVHCFDIAAMDVAHKPLIWHMYLLMLIDTGRYERAQALAEYVFSNDEKKEFIELSDGTKERLFSPRDMKRKFTPIHRWHNFNSVNKSPQNIAGKRTFEDLLFQLYQINKDYDKWEAFLLEKLRQNPDDKGLMETLLGVTVQYNKDATDQVTAFFDELLKKYPLNWRYHIRAYKLYYNLALSVPEKEHEYKYQALEAILRAKAIAKHDQETKLPRPKTYDLFEGKERPPDGLFLNDVLRMIKELMQSAQSEEEFYALRAKGIQCLDDFDQITVEPDSDETLTMLQRNVPGLRAYFRLARFKPPETEKTEPQKDVEQEDKPTSGATP